MSAASLGYLHEVRGNALALSHAELVEVVVGMAGSVLPAGCDDVCLSQTDSTVCSTSKKKKEIQRPNQTPDFGQSGSKITSEESYKRD
jgi:hypothetical protein